MCDRCGPSPLDRRRFLRHLAAGGTLAFAGLLRPDAADAAGGFELRAMGEDHVPSSLRTATAAKPAPSVSTAAVSAPRIITRAQWGANESIRTSDRAYTPIRKLVVHHTASPNNPSNPASVVQAVYQDHVIGRGYADIGYNFLIDHRGNIYEGRWARNYGSDLHDGEDVNGLGVVGAHALGVNAGSCGVCLIGDFTSAKPTSACINALIRLLAWKASRHRIDAWKNDPYTSLFGEPMTFANICGHRDVGQTVCPGDGMMRQMNAVRGSVQSLVGSFPAQTVDIGATIRYTPGTSPITESSPAGNDVRPGATSTTSTTQPGKASSSVAPAAAATAALVGYRVLSSGGGLVTIGKGASLYGSPSGRGSTDTVAITAGPAQSYWTLSQSGAVLGFGGAKTYGSLSSAGDTASAVDLAALRSGGGYWILTSAGGVWAFGGASWKGSLAKSGVGVAGLRIQATPTGKGYWILGANGGVYNYGDASWYGSAARAGAANAVDLWPTRTGKGYWILTASGSVLAFGDASRYGDLSSRSGWKHPAVAIVASPDGRGYDILTADSGVFPFGSAPFFGSLAGSGRQAVAMAPALV